MSIIKNLFENMLSLDEKYESDNIFQLFYDIFMKYNLDDLKELITDFHNYNYEEEVIINCLKLLQYGLSIKELIIIIDYIDQMQMFKSDEQQKPDILNYCNELESIFFDPYRLPKLNEILYYVHIHKANFESVSNKICINLKPYIKTKYFNTTKKEHWYFTGGKIINNNSKQI